MLKINLTNVKIKEESEDKIIYQPEKISKELEYRISLKSKYKYTTYLYFIIGANFIDWIDIGLKYNDDNNSNINKDKIVNFESIPNQGILVSANISSNSCLQIKFKPIDLCTRIIIKSIKFNILTDPIPNHIKWDNIFIINLPRRTDRREQMITKLSNANIHNYEFIEAFDGLDSNIINQYNQIKTNTLCPIVTPGHFACLLSHIKAIKLAKSRNYSNIMILEDDVYFCDDFINKLNKLELPKYDMIYLGGITSRKKLFLSDWCVCDGFRIMSAYGYILSSNLFDDVLSKLEKLLDYVDILYIKQIQPNYKVLLLNDYIKTDLTSSDTSHKSKDLVKRLKYIK